ncbi:MAG: hypothetical protein ACKVTZ_19530 [Bacteroidia bacterium]
MKIHSFPLLIMLTLAMTNSSYSQDFEPLALAKQIFENEKFPNIGNYVTGEYDGRPSKQDLAKGVMTQFLLLEQKDKKAVVSMTISDPTGKAMDTYLFFEKDSIWKMSAFRALAMTGMIEQAKNELENLSPKQVNQIIKAAKKNKKGEESQMFSSKEAYNFALGNAKLTLELDEKIIEHFLKNKKEFERIKDLMLSEVQRTKDEKMTEMKVGEDLKLAYRKLFISAVTMGGYELGNGLNFLIGGMVDNTVGYLYVKDKKDLPQMDASGVIMLREIGNGWYVYKTT